MGSRKGVDQLIKDVANINLESSEDGPWESVVRKQKNKAETDSWLPWCQQNPAPKAWGEPDPVVVDDDGDDKAEHDDDDDDGVLSDDYDDELLSDDYDSDEGPRTHESRKQRKMLKGFFETLDKLNVEEINNPVRRWHCPACQEGPCAIKWYKGLQAFMTHARTKRSIRVKLHREFAALLVEELSRRGISLSPSSNESGIEEKVGAGEEN